MGATIIQFEIPDDLVQIIGSPEATADEAREALVIELLRQHRITQGRASELLGISRGALIDLAARYEVSSGMEDVDELRQQIDRIIVRDQRTLDASSQ